MMAGFVDYLRMAMGWWSKTAGSATPNFRVTHSLSGPTAKAYDLTGQQRAAHDLPGQTMEAHELQ